MITCPSCGQENPEGFRLCGMCGASLTTEPIATRLFVLGYWRLPLR